MPSARKRTDNANADGAGTPTVPNSHTNAPWLVPMPLTVIGSSMISRISGTNAMYVLSPAGILSARPSVHASRTRSTLNGNGAEQDRGDSCPMAAMNLDRVDHLHAEMLQLRSGCCAREQPCQRASPIAEDQCGAGRDDRRGESQRRDHRRMRSEVACEEQSEHREREDPDDPKQAIENDRSGGRCGGYAQSRGGHRPHRVRADARRKERPEKRADEEDAHGGAEGRSAGLVDGAEKRDPAPTHERPIDDDQADGGQQRRRTGAAGGLQHGAHIRFPEHDRGQPDGNDGAHHAPHAGRHARFTVLQSQKLEVRLTSSQYNSAVDASPRARA